MGPFSHWLVFAPLWLVALVHVGAMGLFAVGGWKLRQRLARAGPDDQLGSHQEGYVLGAVSGLLALLIGFTFSMAIDRFDTRRARVLEEATTIESAYLKAQLLGEPYRTQISSLLVAYTDNKVVLGSLRPGRQQDEFLATNERLKNDLWRATVAVFPSVESFDFSSSFVDTMAEVMAIDAARKAGRRAHVPGQVFAILFVYQLMAAGVFGYVLTGRRGREVSAMLLLLFAMSMMLVVEIDRPTTGQINESQDPMIQLKASLHERPPQLFGGFDTPAETPGMRR